MKTINYLTIAILMIGLVSCVNNKVDQKEEKAVVKKEYTPPVIKPDSLVYIRLNDSMRTVIKKRGKKIIYATGFALKKELKLAIRDGGTAHAVAFCNTRAMEITDSISVENQAEIRRISNKNRNPLNKMDENEENLFKNYIITYINGVGAKASVSWNETGNPVYYYPIYIDPVCLNCHGTIGTEVNPEVADKIAELYPDDMATEYQKGDPRGLWAVTFPEYRITGID